MNAYELADLIGLCGDGGYNQDAANMLRQQADKISNMQQWEKRYLDHIAELEKDKTSLEKSFDDCLNRLKVKARALKKIEKIIEEGNQEK